MGYAPLWTRTLATIQGVLALLILLTGLIVSAVGYFRRGKSRVALLGALGFLLMLLFSCCSMGWGLADAPILRQLAPGTVSNYFAGRAIILLLLSLVNLVGLSLIIAAVWRGGRGD